MQRAREQLLAGAGLAGDEDGDVARGDAPGGRIRSGIASDAQTKPSCCSGRGSGHNADRSLSATWAACKARALATRRWSARSVMRADASSETVTSAWHKPPLSSPSWIVTTKSRSDC